MSIETKGSQIETSEHFICAPSEIEELRKTCEKEEEEEGEEEKEEKEEEEMEEEEEDDEEEEMEEEEEEEEDIQDVCEKEKEQDVTQLSHALELGNRKAAGRFTTSLVDANVPDANTDIYSQVSLLYAAATGRLNKKTIADPRNAIGLASLRMTSGRIRHALLKSNADINIRSDPFKTPPLVASEMCYAEILKALTDYNGEVNAVDKNGETLLHLAARNDLSAVVDVLLNQYSERDAQGRLKLAVKYVLSAELKLSQHTIRNKVDASQIPRPTAAQGGNFEIAKDPLSVQAVSTGQAKPFHAHITAGRWHKEMVEKLILKGANVNACNNAKMTPLHLACRNGHSSIVEILLDNHAKVDVMKQAQKTPFYFAAKKGHADVVDVLLRRGICDFVKMNETPLHVAVRKDHTKAVEVILKHSCRISGKLTKDEQKHQVNAKNLVEARGIIPIELTKPNSRSVSAEIVWTEKSTPLELMKDFLGHTALDLAVQWKKPKMLKILLSVEPCVYSEKHLGNSFLCLIQTIWPPYRRFETISNQKRKDNNEIVEVRYQNRKHKEIKETANVLINSSKFNANHLNVERSTLLHEVINKCQQCFYDYQTKKSRSQLSHIQTIDDMIQLLLKKGADFNMKNASGQTPLIIASDSGCSHAIQTLFHWGQKSGMKLDFDARDLHGATALIKAAETNHVSVMRLLLNHKVSVNLHDYYGFTALHAAVYQPNRNWCDLHFFCKGLLKRKYMYNNHFDFSVSIGSGHETVSQFHTTNWLKKNLEYDKKNTRFKVEMVKLLLDLEETNVNAIDFRGNTPLDLAVKSSKRITSETFKALENRGAIQNTLEPVDEAPIEVARVDERGRNPLHRLIITYISNYEVEDLKAAKSEPIHERFDLMVCGFLLKLENFEHSTNVTDDKGRTPLHYAVMPPSSLGKQKNLMTVLLIIGSNINATDMYGKTPLHYAEMNDKYDLLVQNGADEGRKDKYGYTPRDLRQLRKSVIINTDNARKLPIGKKTLYTSSDIGRVLNTNHVTELSKQNVAETVRIYSQIPRPKESPEEAIWKVWIENEFPSLNRRVSQLKPLIQRLIERLADGIKAKDWRFECQPVLVGSADEGTKAVISADFDFNFRLIKFSQLCDVFPHPLGPKGYIQLKRKRDSTTRRQRKFDCFFNLDQCLLTDEVNSRFQIVLEDVLHSPHFWRDEHIFEWNLTGMDETKRDKPAGLCKTVRLRMIHPIEDGEGDFLFVNVSIDVVACVHVEDSWLGDQLPVAISPAGKADGCTLVFDRPRFVPSKPFVATFSHTFARISFAPLESRIIRESASLIKAAYIVCKLILYDHRNTTYQLKTSLLFCIEALKIRERCEGKDEDKITKRELAFWVERIMFCFMEFCRHDVYPCYFMPSFRQRVILLSSYHESIDRGKVDEVNVSLDSMFPYRSAAYDIYLDLCPDDTTIDIPIVKSEEFDREEFIRKLSSRNSSY